MKMKLARLSLAVDSICMPFGDFHVRDATEAVIRWQCLRAASPKNKASETSAWAQIQFASLFEWS
jgi:hypothetical protein